VVKWYTIKDGKSMTNETETWNELSVKSIYKDKSVNMIVYRNGKDVTREVIDRLMLKWKDGTVTYKDNKGKTVTKKIEPDTKHQ
jgi:hypothetical protein